MSEPFVAEIIMLGCNYAPTGHALCNGQLLPISQNTALFSLLGTMYGGDGRTTFALPNLQGRAPLHQGQGTGLAERTVGEHGGQLAVTLTQAELPAHDHDAMGRASSGLPPQTSPANNLWAGSAERPYAPAPGDVGMSPAAIGSAGGGAPHNNMPPYLGINFCIALQGVFPSRP